MRYPQRTVRRTVDGRAVDLWLFAGLLLAGVAVANVVACSVKLVQLFV